MSAKEGASDAVLQCNATVQLSSVAGPTESKLDLEAIKTKVKKAKTKKLGAPPVSTAPPSSSNSKKKTKNKG